MKPLRPTVFAVPPDIWLRGPGRRAPRTLLALAERDALLRSAKESFFAGASDRAAAAELHAALARYRATGWRRDRSECDCPARLIGRFGEILWRILFAHDAVPSDRAIRRAIRGPRGLFSFERTQPE